MILPQNIHQISIIYVSLNLWVKCSISVLTMPWIFLPRICSPTFWTHVFFSTHNVPHTVLTSHYFFKSITESLRSERTFKIIKSIHQHSIIPWSPLKHVSRCHCLHVLGTLPLFMNTLFWTRLLQVSFDAFYWSSYGRLFHITILHISWFYRVLWKVSRLMNLSLLICFF